MCCAPAHPASVDKRTLQEQTALLLAVSFQRLSCVQCLLEAGADPDISSKNKETPLYKGAAGNSVIKHSCVTPVYVYSGNAARLFLQRVSWRIRTC